MESFPEERLWERPAGVASPGFHLQHLSGVLDRLFTYARGEALSETQLFSLSREGHPSVNREEHLSLSREEHQQDNAVALVGQFNQQVDQSIAQLKVTPADSLTQFRGVGRKQLPSTVLGLLFHAAEHTQRHVGQLLVTVKILSES